uniref:Reverse transcriptase domain-containing protein n=1 Tax=Elaeophora elaphi TaxID=1147741 RepID=A0A0R3S2B7_9BILA
MRLRELDYETSILILENIKQKLREVKQAKRVLPEGDYKEFKADMFDGLELPFTVNLLISDQDEAPSVSSNIMTRDETETKTLKYNWPS